MEKTYKVSDLKRLISESSNEFKAVLGPNVEKDNKSNNGKAYDDAKKRAKDFDGGLNKEVGEEKAKYEKLDANRTTLDYTPENASEDYKKRVKAQVKGYTSELEMKNGLEKTGDFSDNENIYNGIKDAGKKIHDNEKVMKKSGLQGREWPDEVFDKQEMYESREGMDMRKMINKINNIQEGIERNGLVDFYSERDENGRYGQDGMVKSYDVGYYSVEQAKQDAEESGMDLKTYLAYYASEILYNAPFTWQRLGSGYGYNGKTVSKYENVIIKDIYGQLMFDEYPPESETQYLNEKRNIKTIYFKKTEFLTESHMLSRIPDEFKKEGEQFKMKDKAGNEYLVEWKNNSGQILEHTNKSVFDKSLDKIKKLYEYKTNDTQTSHASRLNEGDESFISTLDKARKIK